MTLGGQSGAIQHRARGGNARRVRTPSVCRARRLRYFDEVRFAAAEFQPARETLLLDRDGERLVERGVVGDVDQLVRQLVEHDGGELVVAIRHHGVEDRIVELAQRGIRRHAADDRVETLARAGVSANFSALASRK